jgi:hypothetical protein
MTRFATLLGGLRAAALALAALVLMTGGAAAEGYAQQKVVYHVNYNGGEDHRAYRGAMRNIQNHINAVGAENLETRVILHGNGVGLLKAARTDDRLQTTVASLKSQGVSFNVCANTLRGRDIDHEADLYDVWEEDIVPSGVAHLSHLQAQGYTYIKP